MLMRKFLGMLLCLLLCGCASFYAVKLDEDKVYPPTKPADVQILKKAPEQPYIVIGEIRAQGETISVQENMEQRLKEKAADMGGDAIILEVKEDTYRIRRDGVIVRQTYGFNLNKIFTKKMVGKIIIYKK
jgi:hypothetical protein